VTLVRQVRFAVTYISCMLALSGAKCACSYAEPVNITVDVSRTMDTEFRAFSDAFAHYVMGEVYDNFGDIPAAVKEYNKALGCRGDIAVIHLKLGSDLLLQGRSGEASTALKKAAELDPAGTKPYLLLGVIQTAQGDFRAAQGWYEKALEYDPESIKVLTFLSDILVVQQDLGKAAAVYEKLLKLRKDDANLFFNLGVIYSRLNIYEKAEVNLRKAIEVSGEYVEAQMLLGSVYEVEGKYAEAVDLYKSAIRDDALNVGAYARLGQVYLRLGDTEKAVAQNRILIHVDKTAPDPYLRIFSVYVTEKKYDKARDILREALGNGVESGVVSANMGYLSSLTGDDERAVEYYGAAAKDSPENPIYAFYLAAAMDRNGDRRGATRILEELVERENSLPEAENYLGYIYAQEGRNLDAAIDLILKALEQSPGNGAYIDSLGWAYYKKGMLDEALTEAKKAAELLPEEAEVKAHLAEIYRAKGDIAAALEAWEEVIKISPDDSKAREEADRAKKEIKKKR
jgi:tetratricopeptide (TPR) repeat protein